MTQYERMSKGLIYNPNDAAILNEQKQFLEKLYDYNATRPSEQELRNKLIKDMFGCVGENCYIEPPFHANWGGKNVFVGDNFYSNFNLTLVDDGKIFIGNNVMIAPCVVIATAAHPIEPSLREKGYQFNRDVHIGNNVWIGASAVILPGVSIGDDTVIGAGSVVCKDIPQGVVAVGNPCRVLRKITEHDRIFYFKDQMIDWNNIDLSGSFCEASESTD